LDIITVCPAIVVEKWFTSLSVSFNNNKLSTEKQCYAPSIISCYELKSKICKIEEKKRKEKNNFIE
jgi:hypothetical protein